jgi:cell filamentation protein
LRRLTPCSQEDKASVAGALAKVHAELILVHPFRDGNGRLARLLALLMALQADLPPLDFSPIARRGKRAYIAAIHAAMGKEYVPLKRLFLRIIDGSQRPAASSRR